ncbi:LysR family transcriptional regulator [Mycolicibacterium elephantis]|uniref:LysR family transcriptional regulator n=1 Tax=Mycolicibacterium elephantis TaxID=81858 RepID=UPI0009EF4C9F|nr:LysR family transcriptional regulator [Mycolicibacterium elephantis]
MSLRLGVHGIELRHLRYFVVVAEEENFHRAADRLHISQSPLSRQMRDLQTELGVELLEPFGRGVRLTPAGRAFATKANVILDSVDAAVEEVRLIGSGKVGTIPVGFETGTAYFGTLGSIMVALRRLHPRITVRLTPMSSAEQWEALRRGEISFGYGNYPPPDLSLNHIVVSRNPLGVVLHRNHPLASRPHFKTENLRGEPILMQPRSLYPRLHDDIIAAVRRRGVDLNVVAEVTDLEALLTLVATGDAASFMPENQVRVLLLGEAVWRPVVDLDIELTEVAMWRPEDDDATLLRPLLDIVRAWPIDLDGAAPGD